LQNIFSFIGRFAKETYHFKEPTNRSYAITRAVCVGRSIYIQSSEDRVLSILTTIHGDNMDRVLRPQYSMIEASILYVSIDNTLSNEASILYSILYPYWRGGGLGSRPKKMYGERLGDGVP